MNPTSPFTSETDAATGLVVPKKGFDVVIDNETIQKLSEITIPEYFYNRYSFGVEVMDALINGDGIMKTQVITVASPRGAGKTTLLMAMLQQLVTHNNKLKCTYISNEECIQQLAYTAQRIGATDIEASNAKDLDRIVELIRTKSLDVVVIDSLPGVTHSSISAPKALESHVTNTLIRTAKETGCTIFLVMHYTKAGVEAGSKNIYHAVDTCISIDKLDIEEYGENCRLISVTKNRFGSQAEVILKMTREGFDFNAPIENHTSGNDCNKSQGIYIQNKIRDNQIILKTIREKGKMGGCKIQDFADIGVDISRVERLLKELENRGKVSVTGGGKGNSKDSKRWHLGDVMSKDFGEDDDDC